MHLVKSTRQLYYIHWQCVKHAMLKHTQVRLNNTMYSRSSEKNSIAMMMEETTVMTPPDSVRVKKSSLTFPKASSLRSLSNASPMLPALFLSLGTELPGLPLNQLLLLLRILMLLDSNLDPVTAA